MCRILGIGFRVWAICHGFPPLRHRITLPPPGGSIKRLINWRGDTTRSYFQRRNTRFPLFLIYPCARSCANKSSIWTQLFYYSDSRIINGSTTTYAGHGATIIFCVRLCASRKTCDANTVTGRPRTSRFLNVSLDDRYR
jgi:hypothetical protein